jgi:protein STE50
LASLDQEMLKEVGVETIGQRLAILKAVYYLKVAHGVPIDPDHYVPPCEYLNTNTDIHLRYFFDKAEADDDQDGVTLESLHEIVKEQGKRPLSSLLTTIC